MERRFEFANQIENLICENNINLGQIWFSDEAHFYLSGYVNKQNYRIWGTENPHLTVASPLHPQKLTVWVAMCANGIIGPYIFRDTVNGERYRQMLEEFFIPRAGNLNKIFGHYFMQDGARPHRTRDVFNTLQMHFQDRVVGLGYPEFYGGGIEWPAYSPDLNPLDFFFWGYLKDRIYKDAPRTLGGLETVIGNEISSIKNDLLESAIHNFRIRIRYVIESQGGHFETLVY
jgi:hypothetical protein